MGKEKEKERFLCQRTTVFFFFLCFSYLLYFCAKRKRKKGVGEQVSVKRFSNSLIIHGKILL